VLPELFGNRSPTKQPTASVFATSDGHIQVVALKEAQVEKLFTVLGCRETLADPRFATADARVTNTPAVNDLLTTQFSRGTTAEWLAKLIDAGVPVAEIRNFEAVTADPQFAGRNAFVELESPIRPGRRIRVVGSGYVATPDGPSVDRPPPKLGEHTDAVLREIGYSPAQIVALRASGVI
jgi:formyl-CoA transferase